VLGGLHGDGPRQPIHKASLAMRAAPAAAARGVGSDTVTKKKK